MASDAVHRERMGREMIGARENWAPSEDFGTRKVFRERPVAGWVELISLPRVRAYLVLGGGGAHDAEIVGRLPAARGWTLCIDNA